MILQRLRDNSGHISTQAASSPSSLVTSDRMVVMSNTRLEGDTSRVIVFLLYMIKGYGQVESIHSFSIISINKIEANFWFQIAYTEDELLVTITRYVSAACTSDM
jgi:hypothetical protein